MRNFLKLKKGKITIFLIFFLNQFLINSYAYNYKEIPSTDSIKSSIKKNKNLKFNLFITEKKSNNNELIIQEVIEIENFVEDILEKNDYEKVNTQVKQTKDIKTNLDESKKANRNNDNDNDDIESLIEERTKIIKNQDKNIISSKELSEKNKIIKLPLLQKVLFLLLNLNPSRDM